LSTKTIQFIVHLLAIIAGLCSLLAVGLTQPPFNVPPLVAGGFALAATVMTYIANQLPALGDSTPQPPSPPLP
jgi:uncharacterized membrane protein YuzA (DUF378 family)